MGHSPAQTIVESVTETLAPSPSVRKQSSLDARDKAGTEMWLGPSPTPPPRHSAGRGSHWQLAGSLQGFPYKRDPARPQEKAQGCTCRLREEPLLLGFPWVGRDGRVEGGRPACPPSGVQVGRIPPSTPAGQKGLTWTCPCAPRI